MKIHTSILCKSKSTFDKSMIKLYNLNYTIRNIGSVTAQQCFVRQAVCLILRVVWACVQGSCPSSTSLFFIPDSIHHPAGGLQLTDNLWSIITLRNPCSANSSCVRPTAARAGNDEMIIYISSLANKGKEVQFSTLLSFNISLGLVS